MKVLLIGADGQLGTDLGKVIPHKDLIPLTIKDINITDRERTEQVIKKYSPSVVVNTAAYHVVDECEEQDALAFQVNAIGVKNLCRACKVSDAALVHISTGYVFSGEKGRPYHEDEAPGPGTVYAISKLAGEYYAQYMLKKYFVIRSSGLFGAAGCLATKGLNFVELMLKLVREKGQVRVVDDQVITPTYTLDLARKIYELIQTSNYGLFHITNSGQCTWYDFAAKIFELTKTKVKLERTSTAEFQAKANRPAYSVLENAHLKSLGMDDLRSWEDALKAYLMEKGYL